MATNSGGWLYEANGTPVDKATADNAQARVLEIKADVSAAKSDAASALSTANSYAGQIAQANTTAGSAIATADNAADRVDALEVMGGVQPGSVNDANMKLHAEQDGGLFNTALKAQISESAPVKTVNGQSPDDSGNIVMPGGGGIIVSGDPNVELAPGQILFLVDSEWTPLSLPLAWWYDAQSLSGMSNGANVATLEDLSGHARTLTQGAAPAAPTYAASSLNGKPALAFDGNSYLTSAPFSEGIQGPVTVMAVAKLDALGSSMTFVDGTSTSTRAGFGVLGAGQWFAVRANLISGGSADTALHLFTVILDGVNSSMWIDGAQVFAGDAGTAAYPAGVTLGARQDGQNRVNGRIGEMWMTQGRMTPTEISDATAYLTEKWGL